MITQKRNQILSLLGAISICVVMMFALAFSGRTLAVVHAQEPSPTPTPDAEKEKLQREADLATLRQTKAEAEKAEREARFPKPSTSPLDGKTTIEGAIIESQMISYIALSRAADRIVGALKGHFDAGQNLAVYNEQDVGRMLSYRVATDQIKELMDHGYCQILKPAATNGLCPAPSPSPSPVHGQGVPPAALLPIAQSFLGAFVDMTALLRTNVEIKGQTFVIDEAPLVAEIFRAAQGKSPLYCNQATAPCKVAVKFDSPGSFYYPHVFPPAIDLDRGSEMLRLIENVHLVQGNSLQLIDVIEKDSTQIDKVTDKIKALKNSISTEIPEKTSDSIGLTGALIQANCRALSGEVDVIKNIKPAEDQTDAMIRLVEKVKTHCRRMDPDKLAQILNLGNALVSLRADLQDARTALDESTTKKKGLEDDLSKQLDKLVLNLKPAANDDERKDSAAVAVAQLKALNAQFNDLVKNLVQPQSDGTNPLTGYIRTERLLFALSHDANGQAKDYYWLVVKVINAGGNNRNKTNFVVDIFTGGNRI